MSRPTKPPEELKHDKRRQKNREQIESERDVWIRVAGRRIKRMKSFKK